MAFWSTNAWRASRICAFACALAALSGCKEAPQVQSYAVLEPAKTNAIPPGKRTLVAMIPRKEKVWFVKLSDSALRVESYQEDFHKFLSLLTITDDTNNPVVIAREKDEKGEDKPKQMMKSWEKLRDAPMRERAYRMGKHSNAPELVISSLPASDTGGDLLSNINRWRDQLGLAPAAPGDINSIARKKHLAGSEGYLIDMTGPGKPVAAAPAPPPKGKDEDEEFSAKAPAEWKKVEAKIGLAAYRVTEGDQNADVTVIGAGGDEKANVDRWRGQVGLKPSTEEQFKADRKELEVLGKPAAYFDIPGPEDAGRKRILVAIVPHKGETWYIKMMGPADLVEKQKPNFEAYVKSVSFGTGAKDEQ